MTYSMRNIELNEFKMIYKQIKCDFAKGEYAPYLILYSQLKNGIQKGLIMLDGECETAYALCAEDDGHQFILISLLAVYQEHRGRGYGRAFLEQLRDLYKDKKGIIVEVERPEDAESEGEKSVRKKRIQFYEKAGFCLIPNIDYVIWGVPMYLMALPLKASEEMINTTIEQIMYDIYARIMGKTLIHKMKIRRTEHY